MDSVPRYLLIIGCSQRKRSDPGLLPAIERYDGVNFRVLRKAKREGYWPKNLDVLILSAKYGLLTPDTLIGDYDQRMTQEQALSLKPTVSDNLTVQLAQVEYREVFINLGQTYLLALMDGKIDFGEKVFYASGGIGKKMSQMKRWLKRIAECDGNGLQGDRR